MQEFLLLDRSVLQPQGMDNVKLSVAQLEKDTDNNPMFGSDFFGDPPRRWEVHLDNAYPNVIYDPKYKKYRCYYTLCSWDTASSARTREERAKMGFCPSPARVISLGYAESDDGVHWIKPDLGLVEFEGSRMNNMLFPFAHGTGVFLDEAEPDERKRYKLVTKVDYPGGRSFLAVSFSEDGLHWCDLIPWPRWNPPADSHNFPFRDKRDGLFKVITRIWMDGVRVSAICASRDFINWSEPREIIRGDGYGAQVYSMPVFQYKGLYLGLASMFHEGDRSAPDFDTVDCELTFGCTANHFDRVAPYQYLIPRGKGRYPDGEFDCGGIFASPPVDMGDKLCIYYMGYNGRHTGCRETTFARGFLKKDRFAWYEPREASREGIISTCPVHFFGSHLAVLADVGEGGAISAAVCPKYDGSPYEGYSYEDSELTPEENGYIRISFRGKSLADLRAVPACVVIRFRNTKLYALRGDLVRRADRHYEGVPIVMWR